MILARRVPIALTTAPVTLNQDMKALKTVQGVNAKFLARSLDSAQEAFIPLIDEAGHGTRRLPTERWRDLAVAMPPEEEQVTIVRFLDEATRTTVAAIDHAEHEISFLREYRTRMIADIVTGKLDVRNIELPEVEEVEAQGDRDEDVDVEAEEIADIEETADADE
jgi:type I restriction enzyme S subunit